MPGTWSETEVLGHPLELFTPAGMTRPPFALLYLHPVGNETLRDRPAFIRWLEEFKLPCACPLAPYTWWTDRPWPDFDPECSAEHWLLDHVLPWIRATWGVEPPRIGLFGISMGGQGALRLGFKYPRQFPVVAGIASAIEYHQYYGYGLSLDAMYDSKEQCRQDTVPMHVHPNEQPPFIRFCCDPTDADWHRGNARLHEKLKALGVAHECDLTTEAGGHSWEYFNTMAEPTLRFLHDGLIQSSRRLL